MTVQLLTYAQAISPRYEEKDFTLDVFNRNDQPSAIDKIEEETKQELAEFEAEYQRKKAIIENKRRGRIARINLLYQHVVLVENNSYKNKYPAPKDFIALVEGQIGVIDFVKDPAISGPVTKTAFTVITVASYVYIVPAIKEKSMQLIKDYLAKVPVVGDTIGISLSMGVSIINLPNAFAQWAWDPTKYLVQDCELGDEDCPIFNEDGSPKMVEISNREQTKCLGKFFGIAISVLASPLILQGIIDEVNKIRSLYRANRDWARSFFSSYFAWRVKKLRDIEAQYSIPDLFQNDPILNQPKYRCAKSNQFLIIPFKTLSGRVFQYSVIEDWLLSHHTCPVTEEELRANQLSFDATTYDEIRYRLQSITK
ncbi:MAG: hypothetical protein LBC45_02910 [Chlamydiales bacterium]|jgi:hypothetical protein|nr:hypothetical protein [Chlamydiales bacterium]